MSKAVWLLLRNFLYVMFIGNNHTSFHLWLKETLRKHQKISKYCENDFLQILFLFFTSLLYSLAVKNRHI